MPLTPQEVRRAELAPQRYGGLLLGTLMLLGAWVVARDEGSLLAAADQLLLALGFFAWSWRGWVLSKTG